MPPAHIVESVLEDLTPRQRRALAVPDRASGEFGRKTLRSLIGDGSPNRPVEQIAEPRRGGVHPRTGRVHTFGQDAIRGDDRDRIRGGGVGMQQPDDLVIGRIRRGRRRVRDLDQWNESAVRAAVPERRSPDVRRRPASSLVTSATMAAWRSFHQPSGRAPMTFIASMIQRTDATLVESGYGLLGATAT